MSDSINPLSQASDATELQSTGKRCLQLQVKVTADFFAVLETELAAMMHERLNAFRQRSMLGKWRLRLQGSLNSIAALGLCVSVIIIYLASISKQSNIPGVAFFTLFSLAFFLTRDMKKFISQKDNLFKPYWLWLSRTKAANLLRAAKKIQPFVAEYELCGDVITYYRVSNTGRKIAWKRNLKHCYLNGNHVTLLYKKESSLAPICSSCTKHRRNCPNIWIPWVCKQYRALPPNYHE